MRRLIARIDASHQPGIAILANAEQGSIVQTQDNAVYAVSTPLQRLEHALHIPVALMVIPIFALANAGITIEFGDLRGMLDHTITDGVKLGLVIGRVVGIDGFAWLAIRLRLAAL